MKRLINFVLSLGIATLFTASLSAKASSSGAIDVTTPVRLSTAETSSAHASSISRGWLISVGALADYQLGSNGRTYETVVPVSVRAGHRFSFADIYGEYSYVGSTSSTGAVSVAQTNQEFLLWARRAFPIVRRVSFYGALGGGVHVQSVASAIGSVTDKDTGTPEMIGAVAGGAEWRFARSFAFSLEGRASFAEGYAPNPLFGLAGYLSFLF